MAERTATFNYRTTGVRESGAEVIYLADAMDRTRRRGDELAGALPKLQGQTAALGGAAHAATDEFARFASSGLGPVGVGLANLVNIAPRAAAGLLGVAAGAGQASAMSRLLNTTILSGTAVVLGATTVAAAYTRHLIEQADAYAELHARVRIYTTGAGEALEIEQKLYDQARFSRQGADSTVRLFSRLMPEMADFGKTPTDAVNIAGLIQKAMTIQGASGQESRYGVIDLIHALGTGQLGGRQLRGLQTEAPVLLRYIADNLPNAKGGFGVPYGDLAEMAKAKQLGADKVFAALERAQPQIEKDFVNAPKTAAQGWQILNDQITRAVGQIAQASGLQKGLFDWLDGLTTKADEFRKKLLMDPKAIQGVREFGDFVGSAVASIGNLGEIAVKHFDEIVMAGQAVIALKLGEVIASWFARAAQAAVGVRANLATLFKDMALQSGAMNSAPEDVKAAADLRAAASQRVAQAAQLEEVASQKAAAAAAQKAIADQAARAAAETRASATATEAEISQADAVASKTSELATRAKTQADTAAARAATQKGIATAATAAAEEAETAVMAQATVATDLWTLSKRAGAAAVTALGGAVGIATIAIGALIYAIWRENEAYKAELQAVRDSMDVKVQLARIEGQLAGAIDQSSAALERNRQAALNSARANMAAAEAKVASMKADLAERKAASDKLTAGDGAEGFVFGSDPAVSHAEHVIADYQSALDGMRRKFDFDAAQTELPVQQARAREMRADRDNGLDADQLAARREAAQKEVEAAKVRIEAADRATAAAKIEMDAAAKTGDTAKTTAASAKYQSLVGWGNLYRGQLDVAQEQLAASTPRERSAIHDATGKAVKTPAGTVNRYMALVNDQTYSDFDHAIARVEAGVGPDGKPAVFDATTHQLYEALGKDQLAAIDKYLAMVRSIDAVNKANNQAVAATGRSREELKALALAQLNQELATSKAAKSQDAYARALQAAGVAIDQEGKKEAKVAEAIKAFQAANGGALPSTAYNDLLRARLADRMAEVKAAEGRASGFYSEASKQVDSKRLSPSEKGGVTTDQAIVYAKALEDEKYDIAVAAARKKYDEEHAQQVRSDEQRIKDERELQDTIAALNTERAKRQVEAEAAIRRKAQEGYERDVQAMTDKLASAFHDLVFTGDWKNFGRQIMTDILEEMYKELIGNPLRMLIHQVISAMMHPDSYGGGSFGSGGFGGIFKAIGNFFTGGGGSGGSSMDGAGDLLDGSTLFAADGIVGIPYGKGPRADDVLARVSRDESIINAPGTQRNRGILQAINKGATFQVLPGFADGIVGLGGAGRSVAPALVPSVLRNRAAGGPVLHFHQGDTYFNAPGADAQQLKALQREHEEYRRREPERFRGYYNAMQGRPV